LARLTEIIERAAKAGVRLQARDGGMPAGHNGPWRDGETGVRTTAHWAIVFHEAYTRTRRQEFLDAAVRACNHLILKEHRPASATFVCRLPKPGKPRCNGLIGQAWAVEPLILIGSSLGATEYLDVADSVLSLHPYDSVQHGWHVVEVDGQPLAVQGTFNQQIWFCSMNWLFEGSRGEASSPRSVAARDFTEWLKRTLRLTDRSLFPHRISVPRRRHPTLLSRILPGRHRPRAGAAFDEDYLSLGYHSFVLYGLALLHTSLPRGEATWPTRLTRLIGRGFRGATKHLWGLPPRENLFAYGYNPSGIELAYALATFPDLAHRFAPESPGPEAWVTEQFDRHFNMADGLMNVDAPDPIVLAARLYEAVRLPDWELRVRG
jgi:hypothetical protein